MAILTTIGGVPLFTTIGEALAWARSNGLSGYHTHNWQGQRGYMGGANHLQATGMPLNSNAPIAQQPRQQPRSQAPPPSQSNYGGGGGGY